MNSPSQARSINMVYALEKLNFEEVLQDFGYEKSVVNIDNYIPYQQNDDKEKPQLVLVWEDMLNKHMVLLINDATISAPVNYIIEVTPNFGISKTVVDFARDRLRERKNKSLEEYLEEKLGAKAFDQTIKIDYYV